MSDNWTPVKKIVASDRATSDEFGISVAISGDYLIVGAYAEDEDASGNNSFNGAGSAYIFKNNAGNWVQLNKIVASDRSFVDRFGEAVDISGDYAIVGAYFESQDASGGNTLTTSGSAYIFKNTAGSWKQVNKLVASDRSAEDRFGEAVAISGNYAMVGAWNEDEDANGSVTMNDAGSVYIYKNAVSTGVDEHEFETTLKVFPNPGNGNYMVDLGEDFENTVVSISDIYGKLIQSKTVTNSQVFEINILEPSGIYIIEFKSGDKNAVIRIVKE
ncbi:MAG: T9SS C-terminal target domain-containing protein [Bacteroidetes bacterium]|nr:T9SS C-terminal target domain-containing protein [Bacteroidota bacterium]